ncbi:MAG: DUF4390 domain-containing protein [Thiobacillus sp.]|nr:DUF4390 domain-containing protein [Thiobacillus sp.]
MPSTMDFSTPCCAKPDAAFRWLTGLLLGLWLATAGAAPATEKSAVSQAAIVMTQQGYALDAEVNIALNRTLENALSKGINLYFLLELELTRPRNWWFDESIVESTRKMRLYYHLLLRRYVVETGYTTHTVATLPEALGLLGRVEDWQVLERGALRPGQRYDARLRLRLDAAQLPKPLSLGAVAGDKWDMATPWYEWSFEPPAASPAPVSQPLP